MTLKIALKPIFYRFLEIRPISGALIDILIHARNFARRLTSILQLTFCSILNVWSQEGLKQITPFFGSCKPVMGPMTLKFLEGQ